MPVKKGTATVTVLCRNSSLICCCSILPCGRFSACGARDACVIAAMVHPQLPIVVASAPGTWAPQLLLLQTALPSLPYSLTFSMPSTGTAVGKVLAGNGMCGTQGWEGRARRGKAYEEKEYSFSESGINFHLVCPTAIRQGHSFPCRRQLFECWGKKWTLYKKPLPCVPHSYELN